MGTDYRHAGPARGRDGSHDAGGWYAPDWQRGRAMRAPGVLLWLAAGVLTAWVVAVTGYAILSEDRAPAQATDNSYHLRAAYEDRISRLRAEVDSINGELVRKKMSQREFDAALSELRRRQRVLEERQRQLDALLDDAGHPALHGAAMAPVPGKRSDALRPGTLTLSFVPREAEGYSLASAGAGGKDTLAALARSQEKLEAAQNAALVRLETRALAATNTFENILADLGIDLDVGAPVHDAARAAAPVGGPFVPVILDNADARPGFDRRIAQVRRRMALSAGLYAGLMTLPVRRPLDDASEITSGFGTRHDPFLGTMAMHSGTDFRAAQGTPVLATADGVVESAGRNGGYGQVVDIRHDNGISTRYAHMSEILVKEGQTVHAGDVIGRAGSSGRSTGPHLHYETRINGEPVDARRFITAGDRFFEQLLK